MKVVYIAHRLGSGPDRSANLDRADRWLLWAALQPGIAPIAPWIPLARSWDESQRDRGLAIDLAIVARVDEVWLCGGFVSPGMQLEREQAKRLGLVVVDMTHLGEEPPCCSEDATW